MRTWGGGLSRRGAGGRRRGRRPLLLAALLAALALPAAATSFRAEAWTGALRDLFLSSETGPRSRDRSGLLARLFGDEGLRVTTRLLPGEDSPVHAARRLALSFHRRAPGDGFLAPARGGSPGSLLVPEPGTLALVFGGLLIGAALVRGRARR
jgi:hypothetical protein